MATPIPDRERASQHSTIELNNFSASSSLEHVHPPSSHDNLPPTDRGRAAWVALACCTLAQAPIWGYSVSFGIFQQYYTSLPSLSSSPASSIATVGSLQQGLMYLSMPAIFLVLHRYPRLRKWSSRAGLLLTAASLVASAFATSIAGLIATQGALYALGCGLLFSPVSMYMDEWFVERKGLALGTMWAGKSAVGVAMPFVFKGLLSRVGLRNTLLAWTGTSVLLMLPTLFFLKPRVPWEEAPRRRAINFGFLGRPSFWTVQVGIVTQSAGYLMPATYLASYASAIGLPSVTGPVLLALFSLSSVPGGIVIGSLGDRCRAATVIVLSSVGSALPVFLLWGMDRHLATMVVFVLLYGFFAGGFSSTWSSMVAEIKRGDGNGGRGGGEADSAVLLGMLLGGRGLGFIVGGPLSGALIDNAVGAGDFGYATKYGGLILFTGVTGLLGAWAPFCKMVRLGKEAVQRRSSNWVWKWMIERAL